MPGVGIRGKPIITVAPANADEVVAILRHANEHQFTIAPVGGGTDLSVSQQPPDVLLQTARLTEVEHYDHADLTVGIGAGMTVAQLSAMVGADKLMFACDPPLPERGTIGGVLAAAKHGPLRHGYGSVRDFCIGVRFVTGDGRKAKGGGRVVKNVAGYDMMKLLIGSYGTLGIITSASFKLFPAPRNTLTFLAEFGTWQEALKFRDLVARSPLAPICLELVSPRARKMMRPEMADDAWVICIRAAGSDAVLARYRKELGSAVAREVAAADEHEVWRAIENFPGSTKQEVVAESSSLPRFNISIPSARVDTTLSAIEDFAAEGLGPTPVIGRVGVGHLLAVPWPSPESSVELVTAAIDKFEFHLLRALPSSACVSKSPARKLCLSTLNPEKGPEKAMRAVKQALDPNNVLRGRETL
jgi:FAD/FMN-containing dehydrogenase